MSNDREIEDEVDICGNLRQLKDSKERWKKRRKGRNFTNEKEFPKISSGK